MSTDTIKAQPRELTSKGAVRSLRKNGQIPAVIYGAGKPADSISVNGHDILMSFQRGHFFTSRHMLDMGDKKVEVLARDAQRHPVTEDILHIDFLRFQADKQVHIEVQIRIVDENKSNGLKIGGVLQIIRQKIEVVCRADSIPEEIVVSVAGKEIGDSVHMSEITLPEGVKPAIQDRDFTVAAIVSTRTSNMDDSETTEGEAAEGEESTEEKSEE